MHTAQVIAKPVLLVGAAQPGTFEIGAQPGGLLRVIVNVDADGQTARYRSEMIIDGKVVSGNSDSLRVKRGA